MKSAQYIKAALTDPSDPLALLLIIFSISLIWMPFGLNIPPTYEEWIALESVREIGFWHTGFHFTTERPLIFLPYALGYIVSPGKFFGINIIQLISMVVSSVGIYFFIKKVTNFGSGAALVSALLFAFWPADSGHFTLRTLNISFSISFFIIAANIWFVAEKQKLVYILVIASQSISLLVYDGGVLPMLFFGVIIYFYQKKINAKNYLNIIIWYAVPICALMLLIYNVKFAGGGYEASIVNKSMAHSGILNLIGESSITTIKAMFRLYIAGWYEPNPIYHENYIFLIISLIYATIILRLYEFVGGNNKCDFEDSNKSVGAFVLLGFAFSVVAYLTYLPTTWNDSTFRVFLFSNIGAALTTTGLLFLLLRRFGFVGVTLFKIIGISLIFVGFYRAIEQHGSYAHYGNLQYSIAKRIVKFAQAHASKKNILMISRPSDGFYDNYASCSVASHCITNAANYISPVGFTRNYYTCELSHSDWREQCTFRPNGVEVSAINPVRFSIFLPYNDTAVASSWSEQSFFKNIYIPKLFSTGKMKTVVPKNSILLIPSKDKNGNAQLWQMQSDFYFRIIDNHLGATPTSHQENNGPFFELLSGQGPAVSEDLFENYMNAFCSANNVFAVVVTKITPDNIKNYMRLTDWKRKSVGSAIIYYVPSEGDLAYYYVNGDEFPYYVNGDEFPIMTDQYNWFGKSIAIHTHKECADLSLSGKGIPGQVGAITITIHSNKAEANYKIESNTVNVMLPKNGVSTLTANKTWIPNQYNHSGDTRNLSVLYKIEPRASCSESK